MLNSLRILRLGFLYFVLVFGAGFILGPLRVLFLEPQLGSRTAELLEMPIMLVVIWLASGWLMRHFLIGLKLGEQIGVGVVAVVGVLVADVAVGVLLRGMTVSEVFLRRDLVSSVAYYGLLVLCALMPWLRGKGIGQAIPTDP